MQLGAACRLVFIVRDFETSLAFYRDRLGLIPEGSADKDWVCFASEGTQVCLCAFHPGMPYEAAHLGQSPDQHLFRVADIEACREELIRRNVAVGEIQLMSDTVRIAEFRDPDGRYLGLEERRI